MENTKVDLINSIVELSDALQILIVLAADNKDPDFLKYESKAADILKQQYGAFSLYFNEIRHTRDIEELYRVMGDYLSHLERNSSDSNMLLYCLPWINVYGHNGYITEKPSFVDEWETTEQTAEPEQQSRPKGRPKKTFTDCMNGQTEKEKEERLSRLHNAIDGKTGKYVSLYILTAIELGWIVKPTYTQVKNEFGDIGDKSGYNAYLHKCKFSDEEINGAKESLK